jgi:hypothetical protein
MLRLFRPTKPVVSTTEDSLNLPTSIQLDFSRRAHNKQKRLSISHSPNSNNKKKKKKFWKAKNKNQKKSQNHQLLNNSNNHGNTKSHDVESDEATTNTSEMTASLVSSRTGLSSVKSSRTALSTSVSSMKQSDADATNNSMPIGESSSKTDQSPSKPQHHGIMSEHHNGYKESDQSQPKSVRRETKNESGEISLKKNTLRQVQNDPHDNMSSELDKSESRTRDSTRAPSRKQQRSKRPRALSPSNDSLSDSYNTSFSANSVVSPHASLKDLMKAKYYMRYELESSKAERPAVNQERVPLTVIIGPHSNDIDTHMQRVKTIELKENDKSNQHREHGPVDVDDYYEEAQHLKGSQLQIPMKLQSSPKNVSSQISLQKSPVSSAVNLDFTTFDSGTNEQKSSTKWIDRSLVQDSNNESDRKRPVVLDFHPGEENRRDESKAIKTLTVDKNSKHSSMNAKTGLAKANLKAPLRSELEVPLLQSEKVKTKGGPSIQDTTPKIEGHNDSFKASTEDKSNLDETVEKSIHVSGQKSSIKSKSISTHSHRSLEKSHLTKTQDADTKIQKDKKIGATELNHVVEKSVINQTKELKQEVPFQSSNSRQKHNVVKTLVRNDSRNELSSSNQIILQEKGKKKRKDELDALLSSINDIEKELLIKDVESEKDTNQFIMITNFQIVKDGLTNPITRNEGSENATISSSSSLSEFNSDVGSTDSQIKFTTEEKVSRESVVMKKIENAHPISLSSFFESDFGDFEELHNNNSFDEELSILDSLIGDSLSVEEKSDLTRSDSPWISSIKSSSQGSSTSSLDLDFEEFIQECDEEADFHKSLQSSTYEITPIVEGDEEESEMSSILSKEKLGHKFRSRNVMKGTPHADTTSKTLPTHTENIESPSTPYPFKTGIISETKISRVVKRQVSWKEEPEVWCYKPLCEDETTKRDSLRVNESSSGNEDVSEDVSTSLGQSDSDSYATNDLKSVPLQVSTSQEESDISSESDVYLSMSSCSESITSQNSTYSYSSEASESVKYMVNKLKDETERKKRKQRMRIELIQTTIQSTTIHICQ